jgi:hypothetical protein
VRAFSVWLGLAALVIAVPANAVLSNLDADPRLERVEGVSYGSAVKNRILLRDRCSGRPVSHRLSGVHDHVEYIRVRRVDGFAERPEIVFELRTGAGGHLGVTRIVRYGERGQEGCVEPVGLFRYRPDAPPLEPPRRHGTTNWVLELRDYTARFRGKELRLWEGYVKSSDPLCCPSKQRVTRFRFDPEKDRYRPYWTRVASTSS